MGDFFRALLDPSIPFLRNALLMGLLASLAFGVMGSYVVVRRVTYLAGAIAHSVLGGIGAAIYFQRALGWEWAHPLLGGLVAALLSALLVGWASLWAKEREDATISALWAIGMGTGLLFLARTPGYVDPMAYLFGDILLVGRWQVWLVAVLDALVLVLGLGLYQRFQALSFDEEFAALRGVNAKAMSLLLLCLTAVTIVLLVQAVGIILVVALLSLPAATAARFSFSLRQMMAIASFVAAISVAAGFMISFQLDFPTGPIVVLIAALAYLLAAASRKKA